jgi:hypothetical protein
MQEKNISKGKLSNGDPGKSSRRTMEAMSVKAILDICKVTVCMLLCS